MVRSESEIGQFLKARRSVLTPSRVGLPYGVNRRRVRGLRREEVAQLAGVSVDYYTRIEQGRGTGASVDVLEALADALRMSPDERGYLHNLAGHLPRRAAGTSAALAEDRCSPPEAPRPRVRPELRHLIEAMDRVPALVLGPALDLLAWNGIAGRLWPALGDLPEAELNLARMVFLHPEAADIHLDADTMRREIASKLRAESGRNPDEPRLCGLVMRLRRESATFAELWEAREVLEIPHGTHRLRHPWLGELELHFEKMALPTDSGQTLLSYAAEPGSPSDEALRSLAAADSA
ncbi:transcriptional regulator with XRE-family HTH domain [Lipingzhangella halophila]|uniref:Transcriptional regulator with XRE-family HTH domain n=1 Tax=Lipingzhangella halophila TaxID=1783352 RepID=A0A7W7RME1_9ACTN|nr:helix-turn-helix transcriptional regulator [Lipingzhangella halophila]MBB4934659.1 transcriptional regulator with XRE-family HTH domain [Lipingzhangella halophila]